MNEAARGAFGCDTTTNEVLDGIDLGGKLALVTGASSLATNTGIFSMRLI